MVITLVIRPDLYRAATTELLDDHAIVSMDLAINGAFCSAPSAIAASLRVPYEVRDNFELVTTPVPSLIERGAGSVPAYCQRITSPMLNNENTLMWIEQWLWWLRPDMSVAQMGQALHMMRVFGLLVFTAALLLCGFGVATAGAAWWYGLVLLAEMQLFVHSAYLFLPIMLLITAAVYVGAIRSGATRTIGGAAAVGVAVGAWTAFATNLRTSHFPVYIAFALMLFAFSERAPAPAPGRLKRMGLGAALFVAGYFAFSYGAIARHLPEVQGNLPRHTIWHPLVLGLGVPQNPLSVREKITWLDAAAFDAARRIDPSVPYLSHEYEQALFRYYSGLWRNHTSEMIEVYIRKGKAAGKGMVEVLRSRSGIEGRVLRRVLAPLDLLPNGLYFLALYLTIAAVALARAWSGRMRALLVAYLAVAAAMLHVESTIIMSDYVPNYHSYLAFCAVLFSVAAASWLAAAIWDRSPLAGQIARA